MMFKLDSVDAYEQKLVKQIVVAGIGVENSHNKAYVRLISTSNKGGSLSAKVELDALVKGGSSPQDCHGQVGRHSLPEIWQA